MKRAHPTAAAPADNPTDPACQGSAEPDSPTSTSPGQPVVDQEIVDQGKVDDIGDDRHADLVSAATPAALGPRDRETDRGAADRDEVGAWLARQGLPAETVVLVGPRTAASAPMYTPGQACGLTVLGVDLEPDHDDRVMLFTARWERGSRAKLRPFAGELLLELTPAATPGPVSPHPQVDVRMLLAAWGRWHLVGRWPGLGPEWPQVIAPTAAAVLRLHCDHNG